MIKLFDFFYQFVVNFRTRNEDKASKEDKPLKLETISIDEFFEQSRIKEANRPWWNKLWRKIRWTWEGFHYQWIMKNKQRVVNKFTAGFFGPDEDGFEFYYKMAQWAIPRLKSMRKWVHGYPVGISGWKENMTQEESDACYEKWLSMIDDMIFFLEEVVKGEIQYPKPSVRYRRGKYYLFHYFESLWS